jgi:hypothetical protein
VAPQWDEEFRFEVTEDAVLQNEPIEFKVRGWVDGWREGKDERRRRRGKKSIIMLGSIFSFMSTFRIPSAAQQPV